MLRHVITWTGEPASALRPFPSDLDKHAADVEPEPGHLLACFVFFGDLLRGGLPPLGGRRLVQWRRLATGELL